MHRLIWFVSKRGWSAVRFVYYLKLYVINLKQKSFQFWAAFVPCTTNYRDAVARTIDQIDVIRRMVNKYSDVLELVTTSEGKVNQH